MCWNIGIFLLLSSALILQYSYCIEAASEEVVNEVVETVQEVFGDDKCFLKRIALVESKYGRDPKTYRSGYYGGIWQVNEIGFNDTQDVKSHPNLRSRFTKIKGQFGIDWVKTEWEDLVQPLYSGLAARLFLLNVPEAIPGDVQGQGEYWKNHYNKNGAGTADKFVKDIQNLETEGTCKIETVETTTKMTATSTHGPCNQRQPTVEDLVNLLRSVESENAEELGDARSMALRLRNYLGLSFSRGVLFQLTFGEPLCCLEYFHAVCKYCGPINPLFDVDFSEDDDDDKKDEEKRKKKKTKMFKFPLGHIAVAIDLAERMCKICGEDCDKDSCRLPVLPAEEEYLKFVMQHSNIAEKGSRESGVLQTARNDVIALDHVITGIIAGTKRKPDVLQFLGVTELVGSLDTLHYVTLAGDLGQSYRAVRLGINPISLGPGGSWNTECPMEYITEGLGSEASDAEVLGDIDGFILGTVAHLWKDFKLSDVLEQYYTGGIHGDARIKDVNRWDNFHALINPVLLKTQTVNFYAAFDLAQGGFSEEKENALHVVDDFYRKPYVQCSTMARNKYTIDNFLSLLSKLESRTTRLQDTVNNILSLSDVYINSYHYSEFLEDIANLKLSWDEVLYIDRWRRTDGFDLYSMYSILHHLVDPNYKLESGVIADEQGSSVVIGHVLAGVAAGLHDDDEDERIARVFGATVGGEIYEAWRDVEFGPPVFGPMGAWDSTFCPPRYQIAPRSPVTPASHAEILGAMDGFILGMVVNKLSENVKLSTVLNQYYKSTLSIGSFRLKSADRKENFLMHIPRSSIPQYVRNVCEKIDPLFSTPVDCQAKYNDWAHAFLTEFFPSETDTQRLYAATILPSFNVLQEAYLGYANHGGGYDNADVFSSVGFTFSTGSSSSTDALRVSHMLNQVVGHYIPAGTKGAQPGQGGKMYITEWKDMMTYLQDKYGEPVVSSVLSDMTGKLGLAGFYEHGGVGLWDGGSVHKAPDFSSDATETKMWETKSHSLLGDCRYMASTGDCEFYIKCIEKKLGCATDQYPRGFAYPYCKELVEKSIEFNVKGKQWEKKARICLMEALLHRRHAPGMNCDKLGAIAFYTIPDCYLNSGPGFCQIWEDDENAVELYDDFFIFRGMKGPFWEQALIVDRRLSRRCGKDRSDFWETNLKRLSVVNGKYVGDEAAVVTSAGNSGDCSFYEYFEEKFVCKKLGFGHMIDVELPSCLRGYLKFGFQFPQARTWFTNYQKCIMAEYSILYNQADLPGCNVVAVKAITAQSNCIMETNFESVIDSSWMALEEWSDTGSYPYICMQEYYIQPISKDETQLTKAFYLHQIEWKKLIEDAKSNRIKDLTDDSMGDNGAETAIEASSGDCLCVKGSGVRVRPSASVSRIKIGTANTGQCYKYKGNTLAGDEYTWMNIDYMDQDAWIATKFLTKGISADDCSDVCSGDDTRLSHAVANRMLQNAGISRWSSGNNCDVRSRKDCTSLDTIRCRCIRDLIWFKGQSQCTVLVTGGTEVGHSSGEKSHYNGYKIDISLGSCVDSYIKGSLTKIADRINRGKKEPQWVDSRGNIYALELSRNHWDIKYP